MVCSKQTSIKKLPHMQYYTLPYSSFDGIAINCAALNLNNFLTHCVNIVPVNKGADKCIF